MGSPFLFHIRGYPGADSPAPALWSEVYHKPPRDTISSFAAAERN